MAKMVGESGARRDRREPARGPLDDLRSEEPALGQHRLVDGGLDADEELTYARSV